MDTLTKQLQKLGLNKKEAKVYLACLELGETNIRRIAQKSGVNRTTVYDIIVLLKQKGLVNAIKKDKKVYYYAEDPREIKNQLKEKEVLADLIIPELLGLVGFVDRKPQVQFFENVEEGLKKMFIGLLESSEEFVRYWGTEDFYRSKKVDEITNHYIPERIKKKIWSRVITSDTPEMRAQKERDQQELRITKIIPKENYYIKTQITIYAKDKVGLVSFKENFVVIIESKTLHDSLKSIFDTQWDMLSSQ